MRGFSGEAVREYLEAASSQFTVGEYWDSLNYNGGVPDFNQVRAATTGFGCGSTPKSSQAGDCHPIKNESTPDSHRGKAGCPRDMQQSVVCMSLPPQAEAYTWGAGAGCPSTADGELAQGGGRLGDGVRRDDQGHPACGV